MARSRAGGWIWAGVVVLLAAALAARAWTAHRADEAAYRALREEDAGLAALQAENERLRAEIEALREDPAYLERILRQNKMVGPREETPERP